MSASPIPALATSRICEATSACTALRALAAGRVVIVLSFIGVTGLQESGNRLYTWRGSHGQGEAMLKVYGISNCNTVKTARASLAAHGHDYEFLDFKKTPPTRELLQRWCAAFGWER